MVIRSYAKINLSLNVNFKRNDGLHEIQSHFCLIDLADKIKIKSIKGGSDKIKFIGSFSKTISIKDNSVLNILKLLRKLKLISSFYSVIITKKIPVFAGLGGGTGNAAFILKFLLKNEISKTLLNTFEKKIGTDLKLFFYKQGFLKNLGSIINLRKKQKLFFVLVQPKIKCSTREIYSKVKKYSKKRKFISYAMVSRNKYINQLKREGNDLQSVVEKKFPSIKQLITNIKNEKGCYFSRMTGSGSVCYGLFKNQIFAKKALNNLRIKYPKFWVSLAKTV